MNIFRMPEIIGDEEIVDVLMESPAVIIERIVSTGQASLEGFWYDQEEDEWVALLQGSAGLSWEDGRTLEMKAGDWVLIPAHERHRVEWTSSTPACIWLAAKGHFYK